MNTTTTPSTSKMAGLHDVNTDTSSFFSDARLKIPPLKKKYADKDDEDDLSNLFAIPDFWRPSNWLAKSIEEINKQNPLFSWGAEGMYFFLQTMRCR